jgi:DNA segregation ATPase FtsK/SpoIIIE, S-DNA-T family
MTEIEKLTTILKQFKIAATAKHYGQYKGTYYFDIELKPGTRIQSIERYLNEITLALKAPSKPKLEVFSEQGIVRLEYLTKREHKVDLLDLAKDTIWPIGKIQCLLGESVRGEPLFFDLVEAPHTIIGGSSGSGKSTLLHTIIANLVSRNDVELELMDTKNIEFAAYKNYSDNVHTSFAYNECSITMKKLCEEMEYRYTMMAEKGVSETYFPYRVLVIDEFADLIMQDYNKSIYRALVELAQKSRAAGIHIILATQRPDAKVISGEIKANFPCRIATRVSSGIDSKIVLDCSGAEDLLGKGDAIINSSEHKFSRFQVAYFDKNVIKEKKLQLN